MTLQSLHITKLTKVGTSFGIIIPKAIAKAYKWERGDVLVYVFASDDTLSIRRLTDKEIIAIKERERIIEI